jgi:hypothetical protein
MTPSMSLVYEETYKDQSIEIYCFSHFAPGGVGSSHFYAIIDDYRLPGNFDGRSHNPFCPSEIQEIRELPSLRRHLQQPELIATQECNQASNQVSNAGRTASPHPILPES